MKLPWKRYPRRRGASLLTVLVASSLLLMLGMTVAGTAFHHLSMSNRLHHAQTARNLAEAAIAQAVAEIMEKNDKYQGAALGGFSAVPNGSSPNGKGGLLAFDPTELAQYNAGLSNIKLELSINNFGSDAPITVSGRTLPGESAYLRSVGIDSGVERAMECIIYIPKFPWAIASGGKVKISGASRIGAFQNLADINDPSKELPGHLVANSTSDTDALILQGNQVVITGNAQAAGGGDFGQNVVKGERRLYAEMANIPDINIDSYNTLGQTGCLPVTPGAQPPGTVSGLKHCAGAITYPTGLTLDGGVLFVDGDINIQGQISGEGAIISKGKVTIQGSGQVASSNKVAVLSKGDLTLTGTSADHLQLSGIVYSEGKITTDCVSIFGNAVSPSTFGMDLKDSVLNASGSAIVITPPAPPGGPDPELPAGFAFSTSSSPDVLLMGPPPQQLSTQVTAAITAPVSRFIDPATGQYMIRRQTTSAWGDMIPNPSFPSPAYVQQPLPPGMYKSISAVDPTTGGIIWKEVLAPTGPPPLTNADLTIYLGATAVAGDDPQLISKVQTHVANVINAQLLAQSKPPLSGASLTWVNDQISAKFGGNAMLDTTFQATVKTDAVAVDGRVPPGTNPTVSLPPIFTLDLNKEDPVHMTRYLCRAERMRILYWRDVLP